MRIVYSGDVRSRGSDQFKTVEALRADQAIADSLGFNWRDVEVRVNGTLMQTGTLKDTDLIDIVTRSNSKG